MKTDSLRKKTQRRSADFQGLCLVLAAAITLVIAIAAASSCRTTFTTSDEAYVAQALAGFFTDRPMVWAPFLSPVLTRALYVLYRVIPSVAWYAWLQRLLMLVSMTVVNHCVLRRLSRHFDRKGMLAGGLACLCLSNLYIWAFTRMNSYYTVGLCAVALCLLVMEGFGRDRFLWRWLLALGLFFFGVGLLPRMGIGLMCVLLLAAACHLTGMSAKANKNRRRTIRRSVALVAVALAILAGTLAVDTVERNRLCDPRYGEWDAVRRAYFGGDLIRYSGNTGEYEAADWSEDFRNMVLDHYFMDERFGAEELEHLLKNGASIDRSSALEGPVEVFGGAQSSARAMNGLGILVHGLLLLCVFLGLLTGERKRKNLIPAAYVLALDAVWLVFRRRWSLDFYKAFVMASPCLFLMFSNALESVCRLIAILREDGGGTTDRWKRLRGVILLATVCAIAALVGFAGYTTGGDSLLPRQRIAEVFEADREREAEIWEYASAHADQKVVCHWSALSTCDPFKTMKCGALVNLFCDSGAGMYTYPYNEQLRLNGLAAPLKSADLARDDVVFLCQNRAICTRLLRFLSGYYGLNACTVEKETGTGALLVHCQKSFDVEQSFCDEDPPACVMLCEDSQIAEYKPDASITEAGESPKLRWLRSDAFIVYYHLDEEAEASDAVTQVLVDKKTPTKTCEELGFSVRGKHFVGWKAYWANNECWQMADSKGEVVWEREPSKGNAYKRYKDGATLKNLIPTGDELHLYAQWKDEDRRPETEKPGSEQGEDT